MRRPQFGFLKRPLKLGRLTDSENTLTVMGIFIPLLPSCAVTWLGFAKHSDNNSSNWKIKFFIGCDLMFFEK